MENVTRILDRLTPHEASFDFVARVDLERARAEVREYHDTTLYELQRARDEADELRAEVETLETEVETLESERESLRSEVEDADIARSHLAEVRRYAIRLRRGFTLRAKRRRALRRA